MSSIISNILSIANNTLAQKNISINKNQEDISSLRTQSTSSPDTDVNKPSAVSDTSQIIASEKITLSSEGIDLSKTPTSSENISSMTQGELAKKLKNIMDGLGRRNDGEVYLADKEVPKSTDPDRLARAKQATAYIYRKDANPFANLSRDALSAIIYDDSGAYTINERNAALSQRCELENQFWAPIFANAVKTGDWREANTAQLAFYEQLSPMEQSTYQPDFKIKMHAALSEENKKHGGPLPNILLDELGKKYEKMRNESSQSNNEDIDSDSTNRSWSHILKTLALGEN